MTARPSAYDYPINIGCCQSRTLYPCSKAGRRHVHQMCVHLSLPMYSLKEHIISTSVENGHQISCSRKGPAQNTWSRKFAHGLRTFVTREKQNSEYMISTPNLTHPPGRTSYSSPQWKMLQVSRVTSRTPEVTGSGESITATQYDSCTRMIHSPTQMLNMHMRSDVLNHRDGV